jgi:hypothetical protein
MNSHRVSIVCTIMLLFASLQVAAQQIVATTGNGVVPTLVNSSGTLTDVNGKPLTNITGVTFLLYKEEQGGAPLWLETQNVQPDKTGHYSVMLGSTTSQGLPPELFASGEARWLAVQIAGQSEQARVMLLSVPYAMKAGDAATVGGLPPSAFVLAPSASGSSNTNANLPAPLPQPTGSTPVTTAGGTVNQLAKFDASADIANSIITDTGTKVGINTTAPASTLDVKGSATIRGAVTTQGTLSLPATGTATSSGGKNSQALNQTASSFSSSTGKAVTQSFQWQAEPTGNNMANPSGTLNLLFASGTNKLAETGLNIASNGQITFAAGQTFPGTGNGTITGVTAGSDLTGGGTSGNVTLNVDTTKILTGVVAGIDLAGGGTGGVQTLNLDTTKVPQLAAANTFTGNQTVNGNLSATGAVTGSSYQIGSNLFDYGSYGSQDAFLGFAGNATIAGTGNTASGYEALFSNTAGSHNTADGDVALYANTTGGYNTADGIDALVNNTTGSSNTGIGGFSGTTKDSSFISGSNNTFLGANTTLSTGSLSNATAIGADAVVSESNAMALGSINGVNGATADTNVGIGTTTPATTLDIVSSSTYEPLFVESSSGFGTWMQLKNSSSGGKNWAILSAGAANAEGAGNLGITNFTGTSTIYLEGNVNVTGNLTKQSGSFKIDHPLDPANKYLYHSFVESPDMMNVYNGNVITNRRGFATVVLPAYFEALNRDFRYQLTVIGQFAQAIVAREINHNRFTIRTSKPGVKVSWQVTGIRHDAYADAHPIQVEEEKPPQEQGRYLHPELFGASPEQAIGTRPPAPAATADPLKAPLSRLAPGK